MTPLSNAVEDGKDAVLSRWKSWQLRLWQTSQNSALNAGKNIVSALTIDPIKTGFQEYETQNQCSSDYSCQYAE